MIYEYELYIVMALLGGWLNIGVNDRHYEIKRQTHDFLSVNKKELMHSTRLEF